MKHIFKKLHIGHNSSSQHGSTETLGGGGGSGGGGVGGGVSSSPSPSSSSSSSVQTTATSTSSDHHNHRPSSGAANSTQSQTSGMTSNSVGAMNSPLPSGGSGGGQLDSRAGDFMTSEEEFQVQLAMAISASNSDYGGGGGGGGDMVGRDEMRGPNLFDLGGERRRSKDEALAEALSRQYWVG